MYRKTYKSGICVKAGIKRVRNGVGSEMKAISYVDRAGDLVEVENQVCEERRLCLSRCAYRRDGRGNRSDILKRLAKT